MANDAKTIEKSAYAVRVKADSRGREYIQICVPSARGLAWMPLPNKKQNSALHTPEVLEVLLDPAQVPEWKVELLADLYVEFRAEENKRKRKEGSYSDYGEPPATSAARLTAAISIDFVADLESEQRVQEILALVDSETVRERIQAHVIEGMSFVEIARLENPAASKEQIEKTANTVARSVKRGLKKLGEKLSSNLSGFDLV